MARASTKQVRSCRSCAFCAAHSHPKPIAADDAQGACRRYPPTMMAVAGGFTTSFATVRLDMACGEYQPKA